MKDLILYTKPSITSLEVEYATDAALNGWGEDCYKYINQFEERFKTHLDVKYATATSSCTGALHLGFYALGIKPGDEVIMADTNWIASVAPLVHLGAKPVFVDIDPLTWCIDPEKIEAAITDKTKAILAVHLYGNLANMSEILDIAQRFNLAVIEDSAEAIGSQYHQKKAGSIGTFGTFSFHGTKTITTGEGGMFVTNDQDLFQRVTQLNNHGRSPKQVKQFWPEEVGFKYKMSNIQAAIGCAQMERIEELILRKQEIYNLYKDLISNIDGVSINHEQDGCKIGAWINNLVLDKSLNISREMLFENFQKNNIDARVFFWPLSSLDMFTSTKSNLNSWDIPTRAINLPSYHDLTDEDQERVISVVKATIKDLKN
ncbi:MAG TPA: glutamine--scyllo-inositol aminotransferase [Methylophilaceae bacterium]|nr:glutamine--scyllo-inositol aminotransferase [Methylophilaceae bacterium]